MIFGEALAFYETLKQDSKLLVVYHNLANLENILGAWRGNLSQDICVLPVRAITCKVGIWQIPDTQTQIHIWVLRKHPGLAMLSAEETEEVEDEAEDEDDM